MKHSVWDTCAMAGIVAGLLACQPKAEPPDPASCEKYKTQLCAKAGAESDTCKSVGTVVALMPATACAAALVDVNTAIAKLDEQRKSCNDLMNKLCTDIGETTQSCEMVRKMTPSFPPERCASMMGNYDKVLADLRKQEERNKPMSAEKLAAIAAPGGAEFGPADAKVVIVEFSDFECPYCSRAAEVAKQIKEKYATKVRFVFRNFPLSFHQNAQLAAEAAAAANAQGKFWPYHDLMFANQKALERPKLEEYAKKVGLDMAKFKKALDDGAHKEAVKADVALGESVAVDGTPTLFINGERVGNPTDFAAASQIIEKALGNS